MKSSNNQNFMALPQQPSQNHTVISSQVRAPSKKGANAVATTIPTKIIKARSLVRGAPDPI